MDRDHAELVEALRGLEAEGVCEVQVVMMERMRLREQVEAVARSTVGGVRGLFVVGADCSFFVPGYCGCSWEWADCKWTIYGECILA